MAELIKDTRHRATGWPAVFIGLLLVGAVVVVWRTVIGASDAFVARHPAQAAVAILAAAIWMLAAIGTLHNGRRMRRVAGVSWALNVVMPVVGTILPDAFIAVNPWYQAGSSYFYLTTVGALLALGWLFYSRPAHIANRSLQ
ncbi:hypothetical protein [Neoactinobaculum massilliense]|uniref:hypothetical protein n=1 Tax=Neoactinobaculum massilliense TaxID=2364794 RepID=UPI000F54B2E6|nr:hypothetical protein [Neoactinobaculum massilliense]